MTTRKGYCAGDREESILLVLPLVLDGLLGRMEATDKTLKLVREGYLSLLLSIQGSCRTRDLADW